ncbi:MAG: DUF192 domain-containing protein [Candidatus Brocadiia bacterium]
MNWKKHIVIIIAVFLLVAVLMRPAGCGPAGGGGRPTGAAVVTIKAPNVAADTAIHAERTFTIRAEVADTAEKRQKGLSGRRGLEPGYGMIYPYAEPSRPKLSEQGTDFPLSVAFLKPDGTIAGIRRTKENDPAVFQPEEPISYVLELREGWFQDRRLEPGHRLDMPEELPAAAPSAPAETPMR